MYKAGSSLSTYEHERCRLDLFLPPPPNLSALLVWFHGGGLCAGDKEDPVHADLAGILNAKGIGLAVPNYRLSPLVTFPAYVDDAAAAVAWAHRYLRNSATRPVALFVGGHSAGAYLAALVGVNPDYLARYNLRFTDVAGLLPVSGQMLTHFTVRKERGVPNAELHPVIDDAAPCYHVNKDAPAVLAICGDRDWAARAEENRLFIATLKAAGHADATCLEFPDRDHGTIVTLMPQPGDPALQAVIDFIRRHPVPAPDRNR